MSIVHVVAGLDDETAQYFRIATSATSSADFSTDDASRFDFIVEIFIDNVDLFFCGNNNLFVGAGQRMTRRRSGDDSRSDTERRHFLDGNDVVFFD